LSGQDGEFPTFYRELRPSSEEYEPQAMEINGLDRARLVDEGSHPRIAMSDAREWVMELASHQLSGARR
jgi:hypothetical protein